jgi:hypothetical protein
MRSTQVPKSSFSHHTHLLQRHGLLPSRDGRFEQHADICTSRCQNTSRSIPRMASCLAFSLEHDIRSSIACFINMHSMADYVYIKYSSSGQSVNDGLWKSSYNRTEQRWGASMITSMSSFTRLVTNYVHRTQESIQEALCSKGICSKVLCSLTQKAGNHRMYLNPNPKFSLLAANTGTGMILSSVNSTGRNCGACEVNPPPPGMLLNPDSLSARIGRPIAVKLCVGSSWLTSVSERQRQSWCRRWI